MIILLFFLVKADLFCSSKACFNDEFSEYISCSLFDKLTYIHSFIILYSQFIIKLSKVYPFID